VYHQNEDELGGYPLSQPQQILKKYRCNRS